MEAQQIDWSLANKNVESSRAPRQAFPDNRLAQEPQDPPEGQKADLEYRPAGH